MALLPGARFGPYEVEMLVGIGGMGEVYRCRDTRLNRIVAVKVISPALASDAEFLQRFDREANVISTLSHPHICTLHDVGEHEGARYVVMEFLDGVNLADWIATERKRLEPRVLLDRVLAMAIQIAKALDHAHHRGIVHRDLKPGNVLVTSSGLKLVDFGLAKTIQPASVPNDVPTRAALTVEGKIVGTVPYMAPEQLEGKPADSRTDVWAFGCVVHEMLSGHRPFDGSTTVQLMAAIMTTEVAFPAGLDSVKATQLQHFQQRCLAKAPADRWASGHDLVMELRWISALGVPAQTRLDPSRPWVGLAAAAVLLLLASAFIARWMTPSVGASTTRLSLRIPESVPFTVGGLPNAFAISPDGSTVAHITWRDGRANQLHLRRLNSFESTPIAGSDGAVAPFFSPDGKWVGFLAGTQIKKVDVNGGPVLLVGTTADRPGQPSWFTSQQIMFADVNGISEISAGGGSARVLVPIDGTRDEVAFNAPSRLSDGNTLLFAIRHAAGGWNAATIVAHRMDTGQRTVLIEGGYAPRLLPGGYLLFSRAAAVLAVAISRHFEVTGVPQSILDRPINNATFGWSLTSVSTTGTLIYSETSPRMPTRLVWVDRAGRVETALPDLRVFEHPRISPDGKLFVVGIREPGLDIWIGDASARTLERFTFDSAEDESPVWHPDGRRIAFATNRAGGRTTILKAIDGSGGDQRIGDHGPWHHHLGAWSPDGNTLSMAMTESTGTSWNLFQLRLGRPGVAVPEVTLPYTVQATTFSPDGKWLAYASDESGRFEVYIDTPQFGNKRQLSVNGGAEPLWSRDGREIFYRRGDGLIAVSVSTGSALVIGPARPLFEGRFEPIDWGERNYDVSPDGQRFLMIRSESGRGEAEIRVVMNWLDELRSTLAK